MDIVDMKKRDIRHFVHIPKNGGMTIRKSPQLRGKITISGPWSHISRDYTKAVKRTMDSIGDHEGYEHARWRDINPLITSNLKCFAFVRNPWARVVSRYFFAKKVIEVEKKEPVGKHKIDSFEHFLEERDEWKDRNYLWHRAIRGWFNAFDYVSDEKGKIRCDVLSFEDYNKDITQYFGLLNMSEARNVTAVNKKPWTSVYNPKTIQMVGDWYKKDIETFGYDFDSGPTKNTWRTRLFG